MVIMKAQRRRRLLAERFRKYREEKGLSVEEIASRTGKCQKRLYRIMRAQEDYVTVGEVEEYAKVFGCTLYDLIT